MGVPNYSRAEVTDSSSGIDVALDYSLDPYVGYTYRGKVIADKAKIINQIDGGYTMTSAADGVITYTFAASNHITGLYNNKNYGLPDSGFGFSRFSPAQQDAARSSIELWDDLIPQSFVEQKGLGNADITFANSYDPGQAYAFPPYFEKKGINYPGDVFVAAPEVNGTNAWFGFGGYGSTTLTHEIGHTLGLSHPGAYNGAGATTYLAQAEYAQDSEQYTIMSYWDSRETGASIIDWNILAYTNPQAPMLHDILTIQAKYGADPTTRATDTVYGFGSTAGNALYDFASNPYPYYAVYDAGGIDTINASAFTVSQFIDLHAGSFSSIGGSAPSAGKINSSLESYYGYFGEDYPDSGYYTDPEVESLQASIQTRHAGFIASDTGVAGIATTEYQNFAIAYGTTIENAIGGSARDLIRGNEVANTLEGRGGNDVLNGFQGADRLLGGAGNDTFQFSHVEKGDIIVDFSAGDRIDLRQIDAVVGVDGDQAFAFIGSATFSGVAGQLRYADGTISGDTNGDGVADFTVLLTNNPSLGTTDFLF